MPDADDAFVTEHPPQIAELPDRFHGYLDRFSIIGRSVVAEGWGNHLDLKLWYDGVSLDLSTQSVPRPDLVPGFGQEAQDWGFMTCAALPVYEVDRTKFTLQFNSGKTITDPASHFRAHDDTKFEAMTAKFLDAVAEKKGRFLEIGSRARSGNIYRSWFPADIDYVGIDIAAGPNVDVVGDAHHLSRYFDQNFDFMFSIAVFEHIIMPWKVALEMNKVLVDGGMALIVSHGAWPLHEEPWDFFRFSVNSWKGIFNSHTGFEIVDAEYQYPANIIPVYASTDDLQRMSHGRSYLLSGCLVRKIGAAKVSWDAEADEVYDLNYSHS